MFRFSDGTATWEPDSVISAQGGQAAGDGGFVELSGLQDVQFTGSSVSTLASNGENRTFLDRSR